MQSLLAPEAPKHRAFGADFAATDKKTRLAALRPSAFGASPDLSCNIEFVARKREFVRVLNKACKEGIPIVFAPGTKGARGAWPPSRPQLMKAEQMKEQDLYMVARHIVAQCRV